MPDPIYQGRPLSYWLQAYNPSAYFRTHPHGPDPPTTSQAELAIRTVGTNAFPLLLRMLEHRNLQIRWYTLHSRWAPGYVPPENYAALTAFKVLGPVATNAIPDLVAAFDHDNSPFPRQAIPIILGDLGPAASSAIPAMLRGLKHTNRIVRKNSAVALGKIHLEPEKVGPALIGCLSDPDPNVRGQAAEALGAFGTNAQAALPALKQLLKASPPASSAITNLANVRFSTSVSEFWVGQIEDVPMVAEHAKKAILAIEPPTQR